MTDLYTLVQRLQSLVPSLSYTDAEWQPNKVTLHVASGCAGTIERAWVSIWTLCADEGCRPSFEWRDDLRSSMKLDDLSAAPKFTTSNRSTITLTLALVGQQSAEEEPAA